MLGLTATDPVVWAVGAGVTATVTVGSAALLGRARRSRAPDHVQPAAVPHPALVHHTYRDGAPPLHVNGHHPVPAPPAPVSPPAAPGGGAAAADRAPDKPLTLAEMSPAARKLVTAMATSMGVCVVALIALGLLGSFTTQVRVVEPWFDEWAWIVPVVADVGAIVLIQGDFLLTLYGMRIRWLRPVTSLWLLGTLALNLSAAKGHGIDEYVGHALLPLVVIVFTELARALLARWAKLQAPDALGGYEPLPKVRWLLQPVQTWLLWRRRQLLGLHSLQAVTDAEARYALAKGHLRAKYGWTRIKLGWRIRAPREVMWALKRDLLMGDGADEVAAIVSTTLFGDIKRGMRLPEALPEHVDVPALAAPMEPKPMGEAPKPPSKPKPTRAVPAQRRRTAPEARPAASPARHAAPTAAVPGPTAGTDEASTTGPTRRPSPDDAELGAWSEVVRRGYQMYERHLLATGAELDCKTLADELGSNAGYLRTVRLKKWRPRYERLHGPDDVAAEAAPAGPAAAAAPDPVPEPEPAPEPVPEPGSVTENADPAAEPDQTPAPGSNAQPGTGPTPGGEAPHTAARDGVPVTGGDPVRETVPAATTTA